jgi:hypothetical protein
MGHGSKRAKGVREITGRNREGETSWRLRGLLGGDGGGSDREREQKGADDQEGA